MNHMDTENKHEKCERKNLYHDLNLIMINIAFFCTFTKFSAYFPPTIGIYDNFMWQIEIDRVI